MAGCFGVVGGCWGLAPLTGHDPPGCWVSGRGAVGDGGDAVVGDAAPAAGGACQRGRGGLLLQQPPHFCVRKYTIVPITLYGGYVTLFNVSRIQILW